MTKPSSPHVFYIFFFFNDTATTEIYTLSLHDALPISRLQPGALRGDHHAGAARSLDVGANGGRHAGRDSRCAGARPGGHRLVRRDVVRRLAEPARARPAPGPRPWRVELATPRAVARLGAPLRRRDAR